MAWSETVSLEYRVNKAFEGRYFMGHTPVMALRRQSAWGALVNPKGSGIDLFVNTFTVSNYSDTPLRAEVYLNPPQERGIASPYVSVSNTAITPLREPKTQIMYRSAAGAPPAGNKSLFSRVAPASDTVVANYYGKIVVPEGGSFLIFLYAPKEEVNAELGFGWWEDPAARPY